MAPVKVTKVHHAKSDGVRTNCGGLVYDSPDVRFSEKWSEVTCEECKKAAAQKRQRSQKRKKELERKRELQPTRAAQKSQRPSGKDLGYQVEERGGLLPWWLIFYAKDGSKKVVGKFRTERGAKAARTKSIRSRFSGGPGPKRSSSSSQPKFTATGVTSVVSSGFETNRRKH